QYSSSDNISRRQSTVQRKRFNVADYEDVAAIPTSILYPSEAAPPPPYSPHVRPQIAQVAERHGINPLFFTRLSRLSEYEIVLILDDSGSMMIRDGMGPGGREDTRWAELKEFVKVVLEIATVFDENGLDLIFLNRGAMYGVQTYSQVENAFARPPTRSDLTPLSSCFQSCLRQTVESGRQQQQQQPQQPSYSNNTAGRIPSKAGDGFTYPSSPSADQFTGSSSSLLYGSNSSTPSLIAPTSQNRWSLNPANYNNTGQQSFSSSQQQSQPQPPTPRKKTLFLIATDGEPSDGKDVFWNLVCYRPNPQDTPIGIRACTSDDNVMSYLNSLDKAAPNVDVTDDYINEKSEVLKVQGRDFPFSWSDYVVKALLGGIDHSSYFKAIKTLIPGNMAVPRHNEPTEL
ncbi:hypothetical protein HDU76_002167, partial [Blyttiomyces sp. JEL0837]